MMGDKGQPPHPWQYPMYGGYPQQYQQYHPPYDPQQFYNYYPGAMPYDGLNNQPMNPMVQGMPMKQFTHGGQLQPFCQNVSTPQRDQKDEGEKELPPLPPGPPPATPSLPQPSPPGASFFPGPVRFNMNRPQRPQFHPQAFNNSGASKKKRKRSKNKFNQQQQQQQQSPMNFTPPLPPHQLIRTQAPPLPPDSPPAAPLPPPDNVPESKLKALMPLDLKGIQQDWPPSIKDYIARCYTKCENDLERDRMHIILKGKIMKAANDDTLWIKDWNNEPIPMLLSELDTVGVQVFRGKQTPSPAQSKKRQSSTLTNRLGLKFRRSRSKTRSKSRSPHKPRQRSSSRPPRRRRDRSGSSESENDYMPLQSTKKNKGRNLDHGSSKQRGRGKGKAKGKLRSHFYSEFGNEMGDDGVPVNSELLEKRAARFSCVRSDKATTFTVTNMTSLSLCEDTTGDFELEDCHMVGVCQNIEKPYLRLTAAPEPSAVRPPDVLKQSLALVKERWLKARDYHYACEQLKSIRQDLTVQGIRDKLAVMVYETHARIALEKGDHSEFNQCQSQLRLLHDELDSENRREFTAYRILYFIYTNENLEVNTIMTSITAEDFADECVNHALKVRSAWTLNNYHKLFRLYQTAPHMSSYLMDWFLPRERKRALKTIIKAVLGLTRDSVVRGSLTVLPCRPTAH